jgi:transmembrane 9 superfamily protein 2/4
MYSSIFFFKYNYLQSKEEKHFIHNHLTFTVKFHKDPVTELSRIVGFEVKPFRLEYMIPSYIICIDLC